jgi:hypothetical protein
LVTKHTIFSQTAKDVESLFKEARQIIKERGLWTGFERKVKEVEDS